MSRKPADNTRTARSALAKLSAAPVEREVELVGNPKEITPEVRNRMEQAGLSDTEIKYFAMFKKHGPEATVKLGKLATMEAVADVAVNIDAEANLFADQIITSFKFDGLSEDESESEEVKKIKEATEKLIRKEVERLKEEIAEQAKERAKALALRHNNVAFGEDESRAIVASFEAQARSSFSDMQDMMAELANKIKAELAGRQKAEKEVNLVFAKFQGAYQLDSMKIGEDIDKTVTSVISSLSAEEGDSEAVLEIRRATEEEIRRKFIEEQKKIAAQIDEARILLEDARDIDGVRLVISEITLRVGEQTSDLSAALSQIAIAAQTEIAALKQQEELEVARVSAMKSEIESVIAQGAEIATAQEIAAREAEERRAADLALQQQLAEVERLRQMASDLTFVKARVQTMLDDLREDLVIKTDAAVTSLLATMAAEIAPSAEDAAVIAEKKRAVEEAIKAKAEEEKQKLLEQIAKAKEEAEAKENLEEITAFEGEVAAEFAQQISGAVTAVGEVAKRERADLAERKGEVQPAATAIQKISRGFLTRQEIAKKQAAALDIQRLFRGHKGRIEAKVAALHIAKVKIFEGIDEVAQEAVTEIFAHEGGQETEAVTAIRETASGAIAIKAEKRKEAISGEVTRVESEMRSAKRMAHPGRVALAASAQMAVQFESAMEEMSVIVDAAKEHLTEEVTQANRVALVVAAQRERHAAELVRREAAARSKAVGLTLARSAVAIALDATQGEVLASIDSAAQKALSVIVAEENEGEEIAAIKAQARAEIEEKAREKEMVKEKVRAAKAKIETLEDQNEIEAEAAETALSQLATQGDAIALAVAEISAAAQRAVEVKRAADLDAAKSAAAAELESHASSNVTSLGQRAAVAKLSIASVAKGSQSPIVARGSTAGSQEAKAEEAAIEAAKARALEAIALAKKEAEDRVAELEKQKAKMTAAAKSKKAEISTAANKAEALVALGAGKSDITQQFEAVTALIATVPSEFATRVEAIRAAEEAEFRAAADKAVRQTAARIAAQKAVVGTVGAASAQATPAPATTPSPTPLVSLSASSQPAKAAIDHSITTARGTLSSGDVLRAVRALRKTRESGFEDLDTGSKTAINIFAKFFGKDSNTAEVVGFSINVIDRIEKDNPRFFGENSDVSSVSSRNATAINFGKVLGSAAQEVLTQRPDAPSASVRKSPAGLSASKLTDSLSRGGSRR